jgi:hypothetical protein
MREGSHNGGKAQVVVEPGEVRAMRGTARCPYGCEKKHEHEATE